jgi:hypothetical protein
MCQLFLLLDLRNKVFPIDIFQTEIVIWYLLPLCYFPLFITTPQLLFSHFHIVFSFHIFFSFSLLFFLIYNQIIFCGALREQKYRDILIFKYSSVTPHL